MDCKTTRLLLFFSRPDGAESDRTDEQALADHIAACAECEVWSASERALDQALAASMKKVPIPDGLHARLTQKLSSEATAQRRRRFRARARLAAAIAACFVLVGMSVFYFGRRTLPSVDLDWWQRTANDQHASGAKRVEDWFQSEYGVNVSAPPNCNYSLLDYYGIFLHPGGERLPELVFVHGTDRARIIVVTDAQFDLVKAAAESPVNSGGFRVAYRPHPFIPHVGYVILYNTNSLDWLVTEEQPAA
jgi:hypothetical protein